MSSGFDSSAINIGVLAYGVSSLAYALLVFLMMTNWRGRLQGGLLLVACISSSLWAFLIAVQSLYGYPSAIIVSAVELIKNGAWLWFLFNLLTPYFFDENGRGNKIVWGIILSLFVGLLFIHLIELWLVGAALDVFDGVFVGLLGHLLLAIIGLIFIEQIFRNTHPQQRWAIKFLCVGLGVGFAYDFYLYSEAVLFGYLDSDLWDARGFIQALIVPMVGVSIARNPQWSLDVFVSRRVVFHSVAILAVGSYLLLMAAGGYFIRYWGGEWGAIAQIFFFFGAVVMLLILLFSGQLRAKVRLYLSKHFFRYRYDYRQEWIDLTRQLSSECQGERLKVLVIQALAGFVDSNYGLLWLRRESGKYELSGSWGENVSSTVLSPDDSLVKFLKNSQWVIDLVEYYESPEMYADLVIPEWLINLRQGWLVVPLIQHDDLFGWVILGRSKAPRLVNWEERDLLKTAGSQAAGYLALVDASEALVDARQFEAFNRLSAYVVHDLKNVVGQLSLVVENSKIYRGNAEFVDDAFATVDNAVTKMQRMLGQLRTGKASYGVAMAVRLDEILREIVEQCKAAKPCPELLAVDEVMVVADKNRLLSVIKHIVDNAQEATSDSGRVCIGLRRQGAEAVVLVRDTGCGMSEQFIRERLFRPFDTTKGNAGMGIGVYECLEFVRSLGGDVRVDSCVGEGTTFELVFPL